METESYPLWSQDLVEVKSPSSDWLVCFSDLSAFTPRYLTLGFYSQDQLEIVLHGCNRVYFLKHTHIQKQFLKTIAK